MKYAAVLPILLALPALARAQEASPWPGYDQGIRWEKSLEEALLRAAKEGKPVLFHQLVGDLDKEGC